METNRIDGNRLRPSDVVRIVNSTDFGTVLSPGQLHRQTMAAGFRINSSADNRFLNLYRYFAWLVDRKNAPEVTVTTGGGGGYLAHREEMARREAAESLSGRDIGDLPAVEDPERKERCRYDFKLFCETYFPEVYQLEWSDDHLRAIEKIQKSVLEG